MQSILVAAARNLQFIEKFVSLRACEKAHCYALYTA